MLTAGMYACQTLMSRSIWVTFNPRWWAPALWIITQINALVWFAKRRIWGWNDEVQPTSPQSAGPHWRQNHSYCRINRKTTLLTIPFVHVCNESQSSYEVTKPKRLLVKSAQHYTCVIPDLLWLRHLEANSCCSRFLQGPSQKKMRVFISILDTESWTDKCARTYMRAEATVVHLPPPSLLLPEWR